MATDKSEAFERFQHEIQYKAMSRDDNSGIYIFMKYHPDEADKHNLLVYLPGAEMKKSYYRFRNRGEHYYLYLHDREYEIMLPDHISDETAFSFHLTDDKGHRIFLEPYI